MARSSLWDAWFRVNGGRGGASVEVESWGENVGG